MSRVLNSSSKRVNKVESTQQGLISIVVPVYNAEKLLKETLGCLQKQTYQNIEIILVDDGSSDNSAVICKEFSLFDSRFHYVYQENAGAGAARNHGLKTARGEFIIFLDSDDLFEDCLIEKLHSALEFTGSDVAVCRENGFVGTYSPESSLDIEVGHNMPAGTYRPSDLGRAFFQSVTASPWDKMFRKSFIDEHGLEFQNLRFSNDAYFILSALFLANSITWIEDVLVHYRMGQGSSLRDKMYLEPLCDLVMIDALRSEFFSGKYENNRDMIASIDEYTVSLLFSSYSVIAFQSPEAAGVFINELKQKYLPIWNQRDCSNVKCGGFKSRIFLWAVVHLSLDNFIWALSAFEEDPIRNQNSKNAKRYFLRLALSSLPVSSSRIKHG